MITITIQQKKLSFGVITSVKQTYNKIRQSNLHVQILCTVSSLYNFSDHVCEDTHDAADAAAV